MFTGIIKETGIVEALIGKGNITKLSVKAEETSNYLSVGDSVAINGVCLTVSNISKGLLNFDIMDQTLKATTLRYLKRRDSLNLEPALKASDMMSGHNTAQPCSPPTNKTNHSTAVRRARE